MEMVQHVQPVLWTPSSSRARARGAQRQVGQLAAPASPSLIVGLIQMVLVMLETVFKLVCTLFNASGRHVQLVLWAPSSSHARTRRARAGRWGS